MNFTHAAEALCMTQPAVSQHIKYLEEKYEAPLFIRDKKKLTLTPAGEILRSTLETMRNDETTMKNRMKESMIGKKILTFGVTMTIGGYTIIPALCMTQPAVSQHIKYLEEKYEAPLFIRDKKKLTLTPAGEILRSTLETMRNDETTMKNRMKESMIGKKILTFGVTMTIGGYTIIPSLIDFIKSNPDMDFQVRYGNTQTLLSYLHEGSIDFAIVEGYFKADNYNTRVFKTEEYIAVAAKCLKQRSI